MAQNGPEFEATQPVPTNRRDLSFMDMLVTWIAANANNGTWYLGGVIAAAAFGGAFLVTMIGNPIAFLIMGLVGYMGYRIGVSTMALTRPAFGVRGSTFPSILNATQLIGWAGVNTFIAAISISYIFHSMLGWPVFGTPGGDKGVIIGIVIMTILHFISIMAGHKSVKIVERIGVVLILGLGIWETVVVLHSYPLHQIMAWHPQPSASLPIGVAIDSMAAFSLGWVPAIAEFTRYSRNKATSSGAPIIGAFISLFWFVFVGVIGTIGVALKTGSFSPNNSDPSVIVSKLGLGSVALLVIVITATTANAINIMGGGMSVVNITKRAKPIPTLLTVTAIAGVVSAIPILIGSFVNAFIGFLGYVGMIFGPILALMIVDFFIIRKGQYHPEQLEKVSGHYWYYRGFNLIAFGVWVVGVIIDLVLHTIPAVANITGVIYPTIVCSALLYWVIMRKVLQSVPTTQGEEQVVVQ